MPTLPVLELLAIEFGITPGQLVDGRLPSRSKAKQPKDARA
jgi:hypothetical protein